MTDTIAGLPFWQLTYDAQGDMAPGAAQAVVDAVGAAGTSDLVVFSHGWNNSQDVARRLYERWFGQLAPQLEHARTDRPVSVGLVGVFWPAQRWSDEPIPDFAPAPGEGAASGAAAVEARAEPVEVAPELDEATLDQLRAAFPAGVTELDAMAALLRGPQTPAAAQAFLDQLRAFAAAVAVVDDDAGADGQAGADGVPRMLGDEAELLFGRYDAALRALGVTASAGGDGAAGTGGLLRGIWNGAKEALRQTTYWQMKNRAGVVGRHGLGPFIALLHAAHPGVRVHLVGHSFGARLVSGALAGLPSGLDPSPVKAVTLLQGAFSHFAFAPALPHDHARHGALAGMLVRIDGPLAVCFSVHDDAVGRFYPLASIASGDDASAVEDRSYRWGGMGHDGAQASGAGKAEPLGPAGPGVSYPFAAGKALNIDASDVVRRGRAPSGAHSDIVHPELTWVALVAGGIVG